MSKYSDLLNSLEPSEEKKQEFFNKTLQRKKEFEASVTTKAENKSKKPFDWKICRSIVAVSTAAVLIFCAIFIPIMLNRTETSTAKIIILDASASMMATQSNGKSRFENSIEKTRKLGQQTIANNEQVTVILAGKEAKTIVSTKSLDELNMVLDSLECTYGQADIDGATTLANTILSKNKKAEAMLYTAKQYDVSGIEIIDTFENEWNASILAAKNNFDEVPSLANYSFEITVASYNKDADLTVCFEATGVNDELKTVNTQKTVSCKSNEPVVFNFDGLNIYEYDSVRIYIDVEDSFDYDNEFCLYDGRKETVRVLYVSSMPNAYFKAILTSLRHAFRHQWNMEITEGLFGEVELKNYDFYIIEHKMPEKLPTDGLVWLVNPDIAPQGSGFELGEMVNIPNPDGVALSKGQSNSLMDYINPENILVKQYRKIRSYDGYEVLMYCGNDPAFMVKNEANAKVAVLSLSFQYSSFGIQTEIPVLAYNLFNGLFDCYLPATITEHIFEVDEEVGVNARGAVLHIDNEQGFTQTYDSFPNITVPPTPGSYILTQTLMSQKTATDKFFVKISALQSDFSRV